MDDFTMALNKLAASVRGCLEIMSDKTMDAAGKLESILQFVRMDQSDDLGSDSAHPRGMFTHAVVAIISFGVTNNDIRQMKMVAPRLNELLRMLIQT